MLVAIAANVLTRVEADQATKSAAYICPGCSEPVRLAKGRIRRAYFGHRPGAECGYGALESWEHQQAKVDFAAAYRERGLSCEVEVEVLSIDGDRRADVLLYAPGGAYRIAIEVQNSVIDYPALERRTMAYMSAGVAMMWVPVLIRKRLGSPSRIADTNLYYVDQYSAPPWQHWVQDLQGKLWFYDPVVRGVWRGMLDACMLYRNPTSWYADGDEHSAGGHWYVSDRWSSLFLEGPFPLSALRVRRVKLPARKRCSYRLPGGVGADFMLVDEPSDHALPARLGVTETDKGGFQYYRPEVRVGDDWCAARLSTTELPDSLPS